MNYDLLLLLGIIIIIIIIIITKFTFHIPMLFY